MKLSELQLWVLQRIARGLNGHRSLTDLGCFYKPGTKKPIGRLAAHSLTKALERKGLACFWRHGSDQWASLYVAPTDAGRRLLYLPGHGRRG